MSGDDLFNGGSTSELVHLVCQQAFRDLKDMSEESVLSLAVDDIVSRLVEKHRPKTVVLLEDDVWVEETERRTGYQYDPRGRKQPVAIEPAAHLVVFHLPFAGDRNLLGYRPSVTSAPKPKALVGADELQILVGTTGKDSQKVTAEFHEIVDSIKQHLAITTSDLAEVEAQIGDVARPFLARRRDELLRARGLVASLGYPIKRRSESPQTYVTPTIRRKIKPKTAVAHQPEPVLDEVEYANILNILDNMTRVMEKSPRAFKSMREEDIRQHFLVQLNGQYEGQATGETFNYAGRTDILIRLDGRNIFVAECKFWDGEKALLEAIDQLLSYLTWRDTKAALVIFNRNKNLSAVIDSAERAARQHLHYKRGPVEESETRRRYVFGSPGDRTREIIVTTMIFDIPTHT